MDKFKKNLAILNSNEKKRALYLLCLIIILAFLDVLGIASIMPFIGILLNPDFITSNKIVFTLFQFTKKIGIINTRDFTFLFGILVFTLLVITLILRSLVNYLQVHFTNMCEYRIGRTLLENYLSQQYTWFLNQHSSDLEKKILSDTSQVISHCISPMIILTSQTILIFAIILLLIIINPIIALSTLLILSFSYIAIYLSIKKLLFDAGNERAISNKERFFALSETIGSIKEIKLRNLEETFLNRFAKSSLILIKKTILVQAISDLPRYMIEAIAFGGMIMLILVLMSKNISIDQYLSLIALYTFAGYRLLPALQQVYAASTNLKSIDVPLENIFRDLYILKTTKKNSNNLSQIELKESLELKNINFKYPFSKKKVLKNISFKIQAFSKVGIIGLSGSGKTTVVDIILGLHDQLSGSILIDKVEINSSNKKSWQSNIGYVPQSIYLFDDSIAANIAFGLKNDEIDVNKIERAAKIANIHEFIVNNLEHGYNTKVGERGARLSGGQKQRLGIARALYHKPKLIIFDEATSALDNMTEREVMDAIKNINKETTVIIVAHRLSTIEGCDNILLFDKGELKIQGNINNLKLPSTYFDNIIQTKKLIE